MCVDACVGEEENKKTMHQKIFEIRATNKDAVFYLLLVVFKRRRDSETHQCHQVSTRWMGRVGEGGEAADGKEEWRMLVAMLHSATIWPLWQFHSDNRGDSRQTVETMHGSW